MSSCSGHKVYIEQICSFSCLGLSLAVQELHLERLAEGLKEMLRLQGMEEEDKFCESSRATCRSHPSRVPAGVDAGDCNRLLPSRGLPGPAACSLRRASLRAPDEHAVLEESAEESSVLSSEEASNAKDQDFRVTR